MEHANHADHTSRVLVTGADESHAQSLIQCLTSVVRWGCPTKPPQTAAAAAVSTLTRTHARQQSTERQQEHKGAATGHATCVWIVDLGLQPTSRARVEAVASQLDVPVHWLAWREDSAPAHCALRAGTYAWKPLVIARVAQRCDPNSLLFWIDAGCMLRAPLRDTWRAIAVAGVYSPVSSGSLATWTVAPCWQAMGLPPVAVPRTRMRSGGIVGFALGHAHARALLGHWRDVCLLPAIVSPSGSSRQNHRQDQSVLTVLLATAKEAGWWTDTPAYCATLDHLAVHQDVD